MNPILRMAPFLMLIPSLSHASLNLPTLTPPTAQIHTLPNGLTIIIQPDNSAPVVSLQAWCATGSIHENHWLGAGLSHFLEHMLFKGTPSRPAGEISRQIQNHGGYVNAYTSLDRTVFFIDAPSSATLPCLEILTDAILNSTLPEEEFTKEQEVIRREFAMGFDDPNRQASQLMLSTVFSISPFQHPVIGYLDIFNKLTRQDLLDYYHSRYVPNNLIFIISGDVNPQAVLNQLTDTFKNIPRQPLPPLYIPSEPRQLGRRDTHREFPHTELTRLSLSWRTPPIDHPDTPALDLLATILGHGRSSLLNQEIREKKRLAHSISAGLMSLQTEGLFVIQAACDPDKRTQVESDSLSILSSIQNQPPDENLLNRAKRQIFTSQLSQLSTASGRAADLGSSWLLTQNLNFTSHYLNLLAEVSPADLSRVASHYLTPEKLNSTSLNPPGSLQQSSNAQPNPENFPDVQKITLPNGLRLLVREDRRLPLVNISATFRGGLLSENPQNNGITRLMAKTLLKGTKNRSAAQIASEIENLGGSISSDSNNNSLEVQAEALSSDLPLAINLLADILLNPTFDPQQVEIERAAQIAAIKAENENIVAVARNSARENFFKSHPYALRANGSAESVANLTPNDLKSHHQSLVTAQNGVIAIFGDVQTQEVRRLVENAFANLSQKAPALPTPTDPQPLAAPITTKIQMDKQQAVLMVVFPSPPITSPDYPGVSLILEASNHLGSRFYNRIREELGLAYFVGATHLAGPVAGAQFFFLGTDPQKLDLVQSEFLKEISLLATNGLTQEELDRAKKQTISANAIRNQDNGAFASSAALSELLGLGHDYHKRQPQIIEAVTLDQIKTIASKYLNTPNFITTIVSPPSPAQSSTSPENHPQP